MRATSTEAEITSEILPYDKLESVLADLHCKIRCLRRALAVMALLVGFATAGLAYCTVLLPNFPQSLAQFLMQSAVRLCCVLGLASFLSLVVFSTVHWSYRNDYQRKRELRRQHLIGSFDE